LSRIERIQLFRYIHALQCPNLQTRVFVKTSPKRSCAVIENQRIGLVFAKTGSIISGTERRKKENELASTNFHSGVNINAGDSLARQHLPSDAEYMGLPLTGGSQRDVVYLC
jgi:hypothetical protein